MGDKLQDLRSVFLFQLLSSEEAMRVASILQEKTYSKDEKIFSEDDYGETMYIINYGTIKISRGEGEKKKELITFYAGDFFGEIALFDRLPRTATAITLEETSVYEIHRDEFAKLIADHSSIGIKVMYRVIQDLAKRIRRMDIQLDSFYI